jgi:hypothetical protein
VPKFGIVNVLINRTAYKYFGIVISALFTTTYDRPQKLTPLARATPYFKYLDFNFVPNAPDIFVPIKNNLFFFESRTRL